MMLTREEALALAQQRANATGKAFEVWEHVGDYGNPNGDIEARHTFKVQAMGVVDPPRAWALIAIYDFKDPS